MPDLGFLTLLFCAAVLYTSVGHAGASGYLAVMTFYGMSQDLMRPSALVLNIVAAVPTTIQFTRAGHFDRRLFIPLAIGSVPLAAVGGFLKLPLPVFKLFLALALIAAAIRLVLPNKRKAGTTENEAETKRFPFWLGIILGAVLGLLAGLTSIGGGVYLTPILLFAGWADPKKAAGVSAAFILVNSISGLCGQFAMTPDLLSHVSGDLFLWCIVVALGGLIGGRFGSQRFSSITLRRILAFVLILAVVKLITGNPTSKTTEPTYRETR